MVPVVHNVRETVAEVGSTTEPDTESGATSSPTSISKNSNPSASSIICWALEAAVFLSFQSLFRDAKCWRFA